MEKAKGQNCVGVSVSLPVRLAQGLAEHARTRGVPVSRVVAELVAEVVERDNREQD